MARNRTTQIGIRVTPEEKEGIEQRAEQAGLSTTAFIVAAALGEVEVESRYDALERRIKSIDKRLRSVEND